ncbi:hypothetical protein GWI33_010923 [Rhynchophorus ferrugineus]|uniref:Uncharacterized protein n=1 Tax=Rhynchophorus ferrugineus TaxID=354439 RepID=A0A834IBS4_RHYFE|nr:hypothetical protein GWI33_010923 [Rhynchophorus ferrugineus]
MLNASITHEAQRIGNDGVTTTSIYREQLYRNAKNIWIERVLPKHDHQYDNHHSHSHQHLNFAEAAKHYSLDAKNKLNLNLIVPSEKMIVHLTEVDREMLGLSSCWSCQFSLVNPDSVKKMKVIKKNQGLTWYQAQNKVNKVTIIWDEKNKIARSVDIRGLDGRSYSLVKAEIKMVDRQAPWQNQKGYIKKDYADFSD